jgi:hypothetical protein
MSTVTKLQSLLVGKWSNRKQAFYLPHDFAHVVLDITELEPGQLLLTQRYNRAEKPYRERVLTLKKGRAKGDFVIYTDQVGETPKLCKDCAYRLEWVADRACFVGSIKPEQKCKGVLNNQEYYLSADLEVSAVHILTRDEGLDPETLQHVWGQRLKPFLFERL